MTEIKPSKPFLLTLALASILLFSFWMVSQNALADQVVATIPVGGNPSPVAINPITDRIYVLNEGSHSISVIDGSTNSVIDTITVGGNISGDRIDVNAKTNMVYAVSDSTIVVINGTNDKIAASISLGTSDPNSAALKVNPDINAIYEADSGSQMSGGYNYLYVINGTDNTIIKQISTNVDSFAINPVTNNFYTGSWSINVYDGATNTAVGGITTNFYVWHMAFNANTNRLYAVGWYNPDCCSVAYVLGVVDTTTNTVMDKIPLGSQPFGVAVDSSANKVYVTSGNTVSVFDGSTNTLIQNIQLDSTGGVGVNPNTNMVYVANSMNNTVSVIQGGSSKTSTIPSAPQTLVVTAGNAQNSLSWTAPASNGGSAITGYNIYRGTVSGGESSTPIASDITSTSFNDASVTNGQTYYYQVTAVNSVGESARSNEASATPTAPASSGSGNTNPIILNNVQSTSDTTSPSNQVTLSGFDAGSGTNQLLVVGISANNNNAVSVTFNGTPLTQTVSSFTNNDAEFWYLKNPAGTGNIVATFAGQTQAVVGAYSFSGVNQTSPIATHTAKHNTSASSPSVSIATKYANDMVLDLPSIWGSDTLSSPTCTQGWDVSMPSAITGASSSTAASSPSTITCGWKSSTADLWDDVALEIRADSASSGTTSGGTSGTGGTTGPSQATISVNAVNSSGGPLTGMYIELQNPSGTDLQTGYSPASFTVTSGQQYVVYANSYGATQFSHWGNGSTNPALAITQAADMNLTAYYTG